MPTFKATWRQIAVDNNIRRSSQTIALSNQDVFLFGGEVRPRQPVHNKLYQIPLNDTSTEHDHVKILDTPTAPSPRVGSASVTLNGKSYLFSGRGGEAMTPIEENGALHVLDVRIAAWSILEPQSPSPPFPQARSYNAMTSDGNQVIYVHAGCSEKGRLSDLWAFNINQCGWTRLADAPGPQRGGTTIAYVEGKIYRMNGFDGKHEQGYALDVYDVTTNEWSTKTWDVDVGPSPRSVSALLAVKIDGKDALLTMFGECDPSNLGHQGAGKMLDDVWVYDLAAGQWGKVDANGDKPEARGWFAADVARERNHIVVHGGLAEDNTRIGDVWTLAL